VPPSAFWKEDSQEPGLAAWQPARLQGEGTASARSRAWPCSSPSSPLTEGGTAATAGAKSPRPVSCARTVARPWTSRKVT